jgi:HSP20 family protein
MLNRWDPFAEIARLQDQVSRWAAAPGETNYASFTPPVDIYEEKDAIFVKAELPGIQPEEVHIEVENKTLTLRGERKLERKETKDGYHRIERQYGSFTRSFVLPETVDSEHVEAEMNDGVLTVRLPKRAQAQPRRIEVRSGSLPVSTAKPS